MPEDTDQPQPESPVEQASSSLVEPTNAPDSDAPQEQPAQPMFPQVQVNLASDGLHIFVVPAPVNVGVGEEGMDAICTQWIDAHPALFEALLRKRIEQAKAAQSRLQLVTDPKTVRKINKRKQGLQA